MLYEVITGPFKDANLFVVFIDRLLSQDADGNSSAGGAFRMVALVVPAMNPETEEAAPFVTRIYGPHDDPGPVITSYSIHYTKLYDFVLAIVTPRRPVFIVILHSSVIFPLFLSCASPEKASAGYRLILRGNSRNPEKFQFKICADIPHPGHSPGNRRRVFPKMRRQPDSRRLPPFLSK